MTNVNEEQLKKNKEKQAVEATVKDDVTDVSQTELTSSEEVCIIKCFNFVHKLLSVFHKFQSFSR